MRKALRTLIRGVFSLIAEVQIIGVENVPARRLVKIAARSPARSIAGPEVTLMLTSISFARVVFPRPGGQ
ncbi:MAG: hypothetical protein AUK01_12590 [Anaerolineae bacterium CG2_30_57_67]|nr:MAG: hypothetical protein AUK01_12590 [Anaerolineae bacterium CG2_30_57_67]